MAEHKEYAAAAEAMFAGFARRHSLTIEKVEQDEIELLMRVPRQPGLSFELALGLQNADELNIGVGEFWSYFFPFEKVRSLVSSVLDGLVTGDCRLVTHTRRGRVIKRVLEQRAHGKWRGIYTAYAVLDLPFMPRTSTCLYNEDAGGR